MSERHPFVGVTTCPVCGVVFAMRSGIHTYDRAECRDKAQAPHRARGPRTFTCMDCGVEGRAGNAGPLPRRCADCKRRWDCRPERLAKKAEHSRRRRRTE